MLLLNDQLALRDAHSACSAAPESNKHGCKLVSNLQTAHHLSTVVESWRQVIRQRDRERSLYFEGTLLQVLMAELPELDLFTDQDAVVFSAQVSINQVLDCRLHLRIVLPAIRPVNFLLADQFDCDDSALVKPLEHVFLGLAQDELDSTFDGGASLLAFSVQQDVDLGL